MPYYIKRKRNTEPKKKRGKPDLVKKLDKVFSAYIRLRDVMPNGYFRCISCGKIKPFRDGDCGHYHSRMHMATRWEPDNCHMECTYCNRFSAEHIIEYGKNLKNKIGISRYDRLYVLAHSQKHWLDSELEAMIRYYAAEARRLSAEKGIKVSV
jgi:hypothetical protein